MPHPNLVWWFRRVRIEPLNHRMRNGTQRNGGKRCQRCRQVRPLAVREHRQNAIVRMRQGFCRPGFGDLRISSETSMGYGPEPRLKESWKSGYGPNSVALWRYLATMEVSAMCSDPSSGF